MNDIVNNESVLKTAKKRVGFKKHITVYILVNLLLWVVFYFIFKGREDQTFFQTILFISIIWTIIIIGHYFYAIKWNKRMVEKEVEKIINKTEDD
ncbi:MAG: 2TM domain-containing protein [Bacteroidetes bacterium]|nr:2TM domain-containing protein [Bacteroidota bacterium]MCL1969499.1 2TM domain-containing protein [Bacteroidota bacterium]